MLPGLAKDDVANSDRADAIPGGKAGCRVLPIIKGESDRLNVLGGQRGHLVLLAYRQAAWVRPRSVPVSARETLRVNTGAVPVAKGRATLPRHACLILRMGAELQVSGVAAGRIVADLMHNFEAVRNRTVGQLPRETMSLNSALTSATTGNAAVAVFVSTADPEPTGVCLLNLRPEALLNRGTRARKGLSRLGLVGTGTTAKAYASFPDATGPNIKGSITQIAEQTNLDTLTRHRTGSFRSLSGGGGCTRLSYKFASPGTESFQ